MCGTQFTEQNDISVQPLGFLLNVTYIANSDNLLFVRIVLLAGSVKVEQLNQGYIVFILSKKKCEKKLSKEHTGYITPLKTNPFGCTVSDGQKTWFYTDDLSVGGNMVFFPSETCIQTGSVFKKGREGTKVAQQVMHVLLCKIQWHRKHINVQLHTFSK